MNNQNTLVHLNTGLTNRGTLNTTGTTYFRKKMLLHNVFWNNSNTCNLWKFGFVQSTFSIGCTASQSGFKYSLITCGTKHKSKLITSSNVRWCEFNTAKSLQIHVWTCWYVVKYILCSLHTCSLGKLGSSRAQRLIFNSVELSLTFLCFSWYSQSHVALDSLQALFVSHFSQPLALCKLIVPEHEQRKFHYADTW